MALYLGNDKVKLKVILDNIPYVLTLYSRKIITNGVLLTSSNQQVLEDSNGMYLTTKENRYGY